MPKSIGSIERGLIKQIRTLSVGGIRALTWINKSQKEWFIDPQRKQRQLRPQGTWMLVSAPVCLVISLPVAWLLFLPRPLWHLLSEIIFAAHALLFPSLSCVTHFWFLIFVALCQSWSLYVCCLLVQCPSSAFLYPFLCQLIPFSPTTERHSHVAVGCIIFFQFINQRRKDALLSSSSYKNP